MATVIDSFCVKEQREFYWNSPAHVYLATYDTLRQDIDGLSNNNNRSTGPPSRNWIKDGCDLVILDEIQHIRSTSNEYSTTELLYMTTTRARKALNLNGDILGLNSRADFVVLDGKSLKPLYISK